MEMLALQSEQQLPRQTLARNESVATVDEIQGSPSPCHGVDGGDSKDGETSGYSIPFLPEDIWRHIHSLMPVDAAARAACLSHTFLSSWRCYPKLILNWHTLCSKARDGNLRGRIDNILRNHSGIGLKILRLRLHSPSICFPYIDNWLQVAVTPGIEELTLCLHKKYKFPCSLLSDGVRSSIQSLQLDSCVFHPMLELGPLRSLTRLILRDVCITGEELECLLSNSLALEHLDLCTCKEIVFLKIPSALLQLSYLRVCGCWDLQVIENKAPSLSTFTLVGQVSKLSLGEASQMMKVLSLQYPNVVCYARAKLPSIMPNLETLVLGSSAEVNTPMLSTKFLNLKHLTIQISGETLPPSYDYFSLVSFLDASPSLETWYLEVYPEDMEHESVFEGSSDLRQLPEYRHDSLKTVEIIGFSSARCLVELTCCIVRSAVSLERLTLDTLRGGGRCSGRNDGDSSDQICSPVSKAVVKEAFRGVAAIRKYIEDKVPSTAKLVVLEPCPWCHTTTVLDYFGM
ncbi:uncharacterized protein LOC120711149 isoform X1 [Panicum virgatum]|uniref:At1g61320/AtMIF1 LRR domain-containing protein n=2 Tax=Panicum virgatum TaxID=38727 RepID=A0A8T0R5V1_PANVG|nr:uncharacterized protein LOC120711149 isoform X1 [Panicum virgatum]KAG2581057.1 hypothetical protein PVAP13_6KG007400 [Panicum virgatum]KAG2581060.1 hypothetical protein PVAP13_6KG007400 [Panicum virgatum]KAG2581062.1 hypothetical protein PVAP13_6KG007400 [Panicum virgatum]